MNYNIAVVDDIKKDSELLQRGIIRFFSNSSSITCYPNGEDLMKDFQPERFQIIFMDILMRSMNGIETARAIRSVDPHALIVFTTASDEFVFDAFPLHPFDYVLKPYDYNRLNLVLSEAVKFFERSEPFITVRVARSRYEIPFGNISAVQSHDHFVEVVMTMGNSLLCSMKFREFEEILSEDPRFLICNRGIIINMDCVLSLGRNKDTFIMKDNSVYPIKVRANAKILHAFTQYQISRIRGVNKNGF